MILILLIILTETGNLFLLFNIKSLFAESLSVCQSFSVGQSLSFC